MTFEIEDVPVEPKNNDSIIGEIREAARQLRPGQSFVVPADRVRNHLRQRVTNVARELGVTLGCRRQGDGSFRVGRIR